MEFFTLLSFSKTGKIKVLHTAAIHRQLRLEFFTLLSFIKTGEIGDFHTAVVHKNR